MNHIYKIGLAVIRNRRLLLCEPFAFKELITLGGMKEGNETAIENLTREVSEELGKNALLKEETLTYLGNFIDRAAGVSKREVEIELYLGELEGELIPSSEIKAIHWISKNDDMSILSPVVKNKIIPFLIQRNLL